MSSWNTSDAITCYNSFATCEGVIKSSRSVNCSTPLKWEAIFSAVKCLLFTLVSWIAPPDSSRDRPPCQPGVSVLICNLFQYECKCMFCTYYNLTIWRIHTRKILKLWCKSYSPQVKWNKLSGSGRKRGHVRSEMNRCSRYNILSTKHKTYNNNNN